MWFKFNRFIVTVLLLSCPLLSVASAPYVVAPGRVDFNLSQPETKAFVVLNNSDQLLHLHAKLKFYPSNSPILKLGQPLSQKNKDNLLPYLLISPQTLVLKPGQQKTLRVSAQAPANLATGSYRAYLHFSTIEFTQQEKRQKKVNNKAINISLDIHLDTIVSLYGHKGQGLAQIKLSCKRLSADKAQLTASNNSRWLYRGSLAASRRQNSIPLVLLPHTVQHFTVHYPRKALKYHALKEDITHTLHCA